MSRMENKRVLITGGARGIGLATARAFAAAGAELILTDLDEAALAAARDELAAARVHTRRVDVTDAAAVAALAEWVESELGGLDVLINNAGIGHHGEIARTTLDTWRKLVAVNLMGPVHHLDAFLPGMIERGAGQVVNVSSGQAFFRMPTWGAYAAIKAALGVLSEVLHYEVRKHGIAVTTVYPYMVNTGFYDGVEGETWAGRLSMKLLPYYSDSPEKVGRRIFEAVRRRRRVELISPINEVAFYGRVLPLFNQLMSRTSAYFLAGGAD